MIIMFFFKKKKFIFAIFFFILYKELLFENKIFFLVTDFNIGKQKLEIIREQVKKRGGTVDVMENFWTYQYRF